MKNKLDLSEQDLEWMKVAKLVQNKSDSVQKDISVLSNEMSKQNQEDEAFLNQVDKMLGVDSKSAVSKIVIKPVDKPQKKDVEETWDQLVQRACEEIPYDISFDDLLTAEEFDNALKHLDEIEQEFSKKTKLSKIDWTFLIVAVALQCARQYILDPWLKKTRKNASVNDEKGKKGNADAGWYHAKTETILKNRVPFDCNRYSNNTTIQGFLKGGNHRTLTLGHDPLLGWVFGTANILTNTMTRYDLVSAHIKFEQGKGNVIHSLANTGKIFTSCIDRTLHEGTDGKIAIGSAIVREAIHLKSDITTKKSLPIPIISTFSPELAEQLVNYGIDTASVGTEMSLAIAINTIISMVHRLFYDGVTDAKLYEVRTRKILLYSNLIASTSNVIAAILLKNTEILDVGGLLVTIMRVFSDIRFIARIKQEFIEMKLYEDLQGIESDLDIMYKEIIADA